MLAQEWSKGGSARGQEPSFRSGFSQRQSALGKGTWTPHSRFLLGNYGHIPGAPWQIECALWLELWSSGLDTLAPPYFPHALRNPSEASWAKSHSSWNNSLWEMFILSKMYLLNSHMHLLKTQDPLKRLNSEYPLEMVFNWEWISELCLTGRKPRVCGGGVVSRRDLRTGWGLAYQVQRLDKRLMGKSLWPPSRLQRTVCDNFPFGFPEAMMSVPGARIPTQDALFPKHMLSSKLAPLPSLRTGSLDSCSCFLGFLSLRVLLEVWGLNCVQTLGSRG